MSKQVFYGDQVYIEVSSLTQPSDIRLISSNGFLEDNIFGVIPRNFNRANFRTSIFTILPSLVDSKEDLDALRSLGTELSFLSLARSDTVGEKYLQSEIHCKEAQIELTKDTLEALNQKIINEMDNQNVCFGDLLLLQHLESGYYLCAEAASHPNAPNFYNIKLQKERSSACYFRFFSYSEPADRGPLDYDSEMNLMSARLNTSVTMGEAKITADKVELISKDDEDKSFFPLDCVKRDEILKLMAQDSLIIGTSLDPNENKKIKLYEYCQRKDLIDFNQKKIIKNGDYVRFYIDDFYLSAFETPENKNFGLYFQHAEGYKHNILYSIFQIVQKYENDREEDIEEKYPLGTDVQLSSKKLEGATKMEKYYIKHFVTGRYLTVPSQGLQNNSVEDDNGLSEKPEDLPYFHFINNHLKNQKLPLTKNSKVCLQAFLNKDSEGQFYKDGPVKRHEIAQYDLNSTYFIGFKHIQDKNKEKLKLIKKTVAENDTTGAIFRVGMVRDDEMQRILEFESYANSMKRFMKLMQYQMHNVDKIAPEVFAAEFNKVLQHSKGLVQLLKKEEMRNQILALEFNILDMTSRMLYHLLVNISVSELLEGRKYQISDFIQFIANLSDIILSATKNNELTHYHVSQYVRVFIHSLISPNSLFDECAKSEGEILKDKVIMLLRKFLWEKDLDTAGQLPFYQSQIFSSLDDHSDFSLHFLKLIAHYCQLKCPNLENTLRDNFIKSYLDDSTRITKIFPKLAISETRNDYDIEFERPEYPKTMKLSQAPEDVQTYLLWVFRVINSIAPVRSLKFFNIIINYYPEQLCEGLVCSPQVPAQIKNEVLKMLRNIHFAYYKLPIDIIPPKIQVILAPEKLEKFHQNFNKTKQDAEKTLAENLETGGIKQQAAKNLNTGKISIQQLSFDILKDELKSVENGSLDSLSFILELMKGLLDDETSLNNESLCMIYHSLSMITEKVADDLVNKKDSSYSKIFIENGEKIFELLSQVDMYVIRMAFVEALNKVKQRVSKTKSDSALYSLNPALKYQAPLLTSSSVAAFEKEVMESILYSMADEWKSKRKLYELAGKIDNIYTEDRLLKSLWKIVENIDVNFTTKIVNVIKEKTNFESNVVKELSECALLIDEEEVSKFMDLISSLLNLNNILKKLQAIEEFGLSTRESDETLEKIVNNFENILVVIYDYEAHMKEEDTNITKEAAKTSFLQRLRYSKMKAPYEIPFKYKPSCIKISYQRILKVLNAHEIFIPFIKALTFKKSFSNTTDKRFKFATCITMIITILFQYNNNVNQNLLSTYNQFVTGFYKSEVLTMSCEAVVMFSEMCNGNKRLLKVSDEYIYKIFAYTFVGYIRPFTVKKNSANAGVALPVNYIRGLPILLSAELPKDIFNPVEIMENKFKDFYDFMCEDSRISFRKLIEDRNTTALSIELVEILQSSENQIPINMPIFYTILEELLIAEAAFALTEIKERVTALQKVFTLEQTIPFLKNENIEFNFKLKQLTLKTLENLYFKNLYKNINIFIDQSQFMDFMSYLLLDVYGFLKAHVDATDSIFDIFKTDYFSNDEDKEYMEKYDQLVKTDLDKIVFLQFQSVISFGKIWRDYICYVLCDFMGNLISHFKEFMISQQDKMGTDKSVFDIWLSLVLKVRTFFSGDFENNNTNYLTKIDNALKNVIIHSEYSRYNDTIYAVLQKTSKTLQPTKTMMTKQDNKWNSDLEELIVKHLGPKEKYKTQRLEKNLKEIIITLGPNKAVLKKLIQSVTLMDAHVHDISFILKLCRQLIEAQCTSEINKGQAIYRWTDVSSSELKKMARSQSLLNELNIVEALIYLFARFENNYEILREALVLGIALLFGGNRTVQESFYEQFKQDYDNEIIDTFAQILESAFESFRIREALKTRANYLDALKYVFDSLSDPQKYQIVVNNSNVLIEEAVKEELAQKYPRKSPTQQEFASDNTQETMNLGLTVMKFLQSLCEGHYLNFQEFLRDQTLVGHSKSSNIPEFLRQTFHIYHKELNVDNVRIGSQILALIIEMEQGESQENVKLLLKKTFLSDLCNTLNGFNTDLDLLSRGFGFDASHSQFMLLKSKALEVLKDLVERSDVPELKQISQYINLRALISTFKLNITAFHNSKGRYPTKDVLNKDDIWNPHLSSAFMIYFILKHLSFEESSDEFTPEINELFDQSFEEGKGIDKRIGYQYLTQFFRRYTGSIEIVKAKNNKLMRIYFPIPVVYTYLKEDIKEDFAGRVDRSNTQTKVAGLMDASDELISQMNNSYNSRSRFLGVNFGMIYTWLRILTNILAFTVNLLNLLQLQYVQPDIIYKNEESVETQKALNSIQSVISFVLVCLWFSTKFSKYLVYMWDQYVDSNVKEQGILPPDFIQKLDEKPTPEIAQIVLDLRGPYSEEWEYVKHLKQKRVFLRDALFLFQNIDFLWHLCYFGICIGSSFHPLVTAFQLFDIVIRSDTVNRIALSCSRNAKQFMWTIVLLIVTVYVYTIIGLYYLHDRYKDEDGKDLCVDAYACFFASLNQGLRAGGGIGDVLQKSVYDPESRGTFFTDTLYDLSFFILIITLLLNLIFGMIIDAFGELRDEKNQNEDDKKNVCFICGLARSEYERTGNFDKHVLRDHNLWQYLVYILYLQEKNRSYSTEFTDIESYVYDLYTKKDYSWVPVGRSLTLERRFAKDQKDAAEDTAGCVQAVIEQNKQIMSKLNEVYDMITAPSRNVTRTKTIVKK